MEKLQYVTKKNYVRNIILVMSGGHGARFGADCPKQYCMMNGRLVIDYVIDACRNSTLVDEIVIVAADNYIHFISDRYGLPTVCGGKTRPESVANGIKYIKEKFNCQKLIITNAVCPLATCEQYDKYFRLLDQYDFVLTTWKLAPALHRYDGKKVDRDDFFNVMEPDAYNFPELYDSFDFENLHKYIFHNMPENSKGYYCFDYPHTMKLTYPHDLKLLDILYNDLVVRPQKEKTLQVVNNYLSSDGSTQVGQWIIEVQNIVNEMAQKYRVSSYSINSQTEANIVYEAESNHYGSIILKFTPSKFHYHKEYLYYKLASDGIMAKLLDYDEDYNALIIEKVKPGLQVKFDADNIDLRRFYDKINESMISAELLEGDKDVPSVREEFEDYVRAADAYTFEYEFRKCMEKKARQVWDAYFSDVPLFYLHRDLHRRNILMSSNGLLAIDPRGAIGPKEFEYVIPFIIELREDQEHTAAGYKKMFEYFKRYTEPEHFVAALFIFWVYKMNDYTFQKHDNYRLATWCAKSIREIFFHNSGQVLEADIMPDGLERFLYEKKI